MHCSSMRLVAILFWTTMQTLVASSRTAGCGKTAPYVMDSNSVAEGTMSFQDSDVRLGSLERNYGVHLPANYDDTKPTPLIIYLHGQCVGWKDVLSYGRIDPGYYLPNAITLIPSGVDEGICIQWNVGSGGRGDVCDHKRHVPSKYATNFPSCSKTNATSVCNCYGCYDDASFVYELYNKVATELCVDTDRLYAYGVSNGGMFSYRVASTFARQQTPLRGVIPWYGGVLSGMDEGLDSLVGTSLLTMHGVIDAEIPLLGGESIDGYYYMPLRKIQSAVGLQNHCGAAKKVSTPFSGEKLIGCYAAEGCAPSSRGAATQQIRCTFFEGHGFWPRQANIMMEWFFNLTETQHDAILV
eukprot:TRINITY_DN61116_c0_g1_i1.p1 TRINITY_DN61116_c0_g1~~TRINITY_DN61116_c0_g1_i1.p1  ORF type:complete len:355 (-),score=38.45 TRINITY_DN61116_c0_g1_i1:73-1137(-)